MNKELQINISAQKHLSHSIQRLIHDFHFLSHIGNIERSFNSQIYTLVGLLSLDLVQTDFHCEEMGRWEEVKVFWKSKHINRINQVNVLFPFQNGCQQVLGTKSESLNLKSYCVGDERDITWRNESFLRVSDAGKDGVRLLHHGLPWLPPWFPPWLPWDTSPHFPHLNYHQWFPGTLWEQLYSWRTPFIDFKTKVLGSQQTVWEFSEFIFTKHTHTLTVRMTMHKFCCLPGWPSLVTFQLSIPSHSRAETWRH